MATELAQLYSDLLAPEYFVLVCTLALLAFEWRVDDRPTGSRRAATGIAARLLVVVAAWAVAFAIYESTVLLFDPVPSWGEDFTGSLGLGAGMLLVGGAWWARDWGRHLPAYAGLLVALTVVHTAVTPFWDVSSHVAYAVAPAGYLLAADRRFAPLVVLALGMVLARPLAGAHTWPESVGGLVLAGAFLAGLRYWTARRGRTADAAERPA
ncbi:hypothetical protein [Halorussus litoreus]|uniref:hypothetical protein n=1 Tax=Halorussus litoreus TaxID=1710536 RepID=UPI0018E4EC70|nr:hypothetical protein [Halorussus litoreus]